MEALTRLETMRSPSEDSWYQKFLAALGLAAVRTRGDVLNLVFENADAMDDGDLEGYVRDERDGVIFERLHYSPDRREWLARFVATFASTVVSETYVDLSYPEVELGYCLLHDSKTKPSQSLKALAAFHEHYDLQAGRLRLQKSLSTLTP